MEAVKAQEVGVLAVDLAPVAAHAVVGIDVVVAAPGIPCQILPVVVERAFRDR